MDITKTIPGLFRSKKRYAVINVAKVTNQSTSSNEITIDATGLTPEEIAEAYFKKLHEFGHSMSPRNIAVSITGVAKETLHQVFDLINPCKK